jgi:imidazolonepropionase-like amidohydrolase
LQAITVNGAKVLADDDVGTIRPGARADFLLYRGAMDRAEFDARKVTHVAKGGVLYVRDGQWVGPGPP